MAERKNATKIFDATALPASGTVRSAARQVRGGSISIGASWTGTPTGTFALQVSFDGGATWLATPGSALEFTSNGNAQPAGSAGSAVWNFDNVPGTLWSVLYTATGGTGTVTAYASEKK